MSCFANLSDALSSLPFGSSRPDLPRPRIAFMYRHVLADGSAVFAAICDVSDAGARMVVWARSPGAARVMVAWDSGPVSWDDLWPDWSMSDHDMSVRSRAMECLEMASGTADIAESLEFYHC